MELHRCDGTPDGRCRVEAVEENRSLRGGRPYRSTHYRLIHGHDVREPLGIGTVQHLLAEAGIDMADLVEAPAESAE